MVYCFESIDEAIRAGYGDMLDEDLAVRLHNSGFVPVEEIADPGSILFSELEPEGIEALVAEYNLNPCLPAESAMPTPSYGKYTDEQEEMFFEPVVAAEPDEYEHLPRVSACQPRSCEVDWDAKPRARANCRNYSARGRVQHKPQRGISITSVESDNYRLMYEMMRPHFIRASVPHFFL